MNWDQRQIDVFNAIKKTRLNVAVKATAGSGKTTTILEALRYIPAREKSVFLSFSKAIVDELEKKVPANVKAMTLHSLGLRFIRNYYKGMIVEIRDGDRSPKAPKYFGKAIGLFKDGESKKPIDKKDYRTAKLIEEVCRFARMTLTDHNDETALTEMCTYYNIDWNPDVIVGARKLLDKALDPQVGKIIVLDFVDMVYLPAMIPDMINEKYNNVFLDEAQDTNRAQYQLIESILQKDGRLISVGDDNQCIYGFGGADVESFKRIRERPDTMTLPLNVTYRCPKQVVAVAKEVYEDIEAWDQAEEGIFRQGTWDEVKEGDMVLSRTTKPLIDLYFRLIESNIKAKVVGRDFEQGLISIVDQCMSETFEGFYYNLNLKFEEIIKELNRIGILKVTDHPRWRSLDEKKQVIDILRKKTNYPNQLVELIKDIFKEDKKAAHLMTIHRSKGLENKRVFVIYKYDGSDLMPSKHATKPWEHIQENNLRFVAVTRSKSDLIFINLNE